MKTTVLIMAGGIGERFWPKSRKKMPKQFLNLVDKEKTMLQLTIDRIKPLVDLEDIFIATNKDYKDIVLSQIDGIIEENIICEPVPRNTLPCVGLGAVMIKKKYDDAVMIVLSADHFIENNDLFIKRLIEARDIAISTNNLVTLGIKPKYPETGYGYIKCKKQLDSFNTSCDVLKFVEKPNYELALEYLNSGDYLWNSGMFIWKVSDIFSNIKKYLPEEYKKLMLIYESNDLISKINEVFPTFEKQSIDFALLQKASFIKVVLGDFGWDDVGSWNSVFRLKEKDENKNIINGNTLVLDTRNSLIDSGDKLMVVVGLDDVICINQEDLVLVCKKDKVDGIKDVLKKLKDSDRNDLL